MAQLTADVEACYPPIVTADLAQWKLKGSLEDDLGAYGFAWGSETFGQTDLTSGDFVAGPTGFRLGGILFPDALAKAYIESAVPTAQNFSFSFWIAPPAAAPSTYVWGVCHGPGAAFAGNDPGSWLIQIDETNNRLSVQARHVGESYLNEKLYVENIWTLGSGTWILWHLVRNGTSWAIYRDGSLTPAASTTVSAEIYYPGTSPMLVGVRGEAGNALPGYFRGTIGPMHYVIDTPHPASWAQDWWLRMNRNPGKFARQVLTDMGRTIHAASFDAFKPRLGVVAALIV